MRTLAFRLLTVVIVAGFSAVGGAQEALPIAAYEQSLALNPENANAAQQLRQLTGGGMTTLANGSFEATLDGFQIHYEVHGQGPVLMTVPNSWGLSLDGLRGLYRRLEEHFTLVYFDPRGMGGSEAIREEADMGLAAVRSDFHALRRHLSLERVNAIGWSNGAMNLIALAAERPEVFERAIILHTSARLDAEDGERFTRDHPELVELWTSFSQRMSEPGMGKEEKDSLTRSFWVDEYFPALFADSEAGRKKVAELYADTSFSAAHVDYSNRESSTFDLREQLGKITADCLVIAGAHDLLPPDRVREVADGIARARFVVFEKSAHYAPIEEPEAFLAAVRELFTAP